MSLPNLGVSRVGCCMYYFELFETCQKRYSFQLKNDKGKVVLHPGNTGFDSLESARACLEMVRSYAQNPFCYIVKVACSGAYLYELIEQETGNVIAKCGSYDSECEVNDIISDVRYAIPEARIFEDTRH